MVYEDFGRKPPQVGMRLVHIQSWSTHAMSMHINPCTVGEQGGRGEGDPWCRAGGGGEG